MFEMAQAIREMGPVIVLMAFVLFLLWTMFKHQMNESKEERINHQQATLKFTDNMIEYSKVITSLATVISELRACQNAMAAESRAHNENAATAFARIKTEHETIQDHLSSIFDRINDLSKKG